MFIILFIIEIFTSILLILNITRVGKVLGAVRETQIAEHALKQMDYSIENIQNFKYLYIPNIENQVLSQYMSTDSSKRIKPYNPNNKWRLKFF